MNSDVIRLLPDSVANQIAAGEVIQRPASVIKELVENAIDAGATEISIILKDAGRTLIQVVDNGCGMSPGDARMAFERHATSKISSASDLYTLHTMGFRGEALPSIAAVAQIDMRTMRHGESIGTRLLINESKFESQEPCTCVPGTNLMVKNIFFHMPARRKFLKKDSIELNHILHEFERLALVNTNVEFTLIHNDITLHRFGPGTLKQRIGSLFGKNMESQLAHIETETSLAKIEGFIGMPRFAKKRGYQQFFFVNGRNMRHPAFHRAVIKCYEQLISPDSQPSYFINFEVDPSTIDVNIHPQKHEIKFEHEQAIWQILEACVREAIGKSQAAGALDFDAFDAPDIPLFDPSATEMPEIEIEPAYNPFVPAADNRSEASQAYNYRPKTTAVPRDWEKLYDSFSRERDNAMQHQQPEITEAESDPTIFAAPDVAETVQSPASPALFQLDNRYIVSASHGGVLIISQHRAHIRILFERFMAQLADGAITPQALLFPEDFELSPAQSALLTALLPDFVELGFGVSDNGDSRWSITAAPAALQGVSPTEVLLTLLDDVAQTGSPDACALRRPLALSMARNAAIEAGQSLSTAEMDRIVADLFRCAEPAMTPDGLTVMTLIGADEISARFS